MRSTTKKHDAMWSSATHGGDIIDEPSARALEHPAEPHGDKPLCVFKFGGTSLGDKGCIERVIELTRIASRDAAVVVVVSAMCGVTNDLFEAVTAAEKIDYRRVSLIFDALRHKHSIAAQALIRSASELEPVQHRIDELIVYGEELCHDAVRQRNVTERVRDAIVSLGERLSAPVVAGGLRDRGIPSESIEATELIVIDSTHGAAEADASSTRIYCEQRLNPLLLRGSTPVITGYISATAEGVLTTLGRGGSDYSATLVAAALNADEVVIWTDVNGLLTADPRMIAGSCTIPEISYQEATELACFGAKVLHPKTLRPVELLGIPVWIRNTFAPDRRGTKIMRSPSSNRRGVKAVAAIGDTALIAIAGAPSVLKQVSKEAGAFRAEGVSVLQCSCRPNFSFALPSAHADRLAELLRTTFAQDIRDGELRYITLLPSLAVIALVGKNIGVTPDVLARAFGALEREKVQVIAIVEDSSDAQVSFLVDQKDVRTAMIAVHREFELGLIFEETDVGPNTPWNGSWLS